MKNLLSRLHEWGGIALVALLGLALWHWGNPRLEEHAAFVGPEFLVLNATKLVGIALALALTFQLDRFIAPSIRAFVHASHDVGGTVPSVTYRSQFARSWAETPADPRLWISVLYYTVSFFALVIPFA